MGELLKKRTSLPIKRITPYNSVILHSFDDTKHPFIRESRLGRIRLMGEFVKVMPVIFKINPSLF
jgi:hypothetical protein